MMSKLAMFPYYFPEEIFLEIFCKLPVKSLGKCMCVSKAWNSLIKDPYFISSHVSHQSKLRRTKDNNLFFVMTGRHEAEYSLHSDDQEFRKYAQLEYMPFDNHHSIVGACNGLLCLMDFQFSFDSIFILCNPIIRKSITLPKPCLSSLPYKISVGFGFDSAQNDYKLLKITKKGVLDKYVEVELYSLKRNCWKILAPPKYDLYSDDFMVYVNETVHWIAYERVNNEGSYSCKLLILGFDMRDDVFKEIMLPERLRNLPHQSEIYVIPYDELSSIAVIELGSLHAECDIWVMKKYGVVETWTKMYSLGKLGTEPMPRVLGFRKNGDLILRTYNNLRLVSRDPESHEIDYFGIQGRRTYVCNYTESLVLLDRVIDGAMTENRANYAGNANR
ncbi:F-box/kelch-repeat protein At3g23880 [Gossypium raimondii]|uniref:F-box domain-containing protein n=1 Tax=Gossypium raimondii TaxID=29730 RepID=A0A0D2U2M5_GOSRA|nr:F-box/kelch-repeat protein At3g23880 [Gossypium raimondii]KJB81903.1 hypothetical protein B456_013G166900 [Gossypium raimondii]MBA0602997.1 hypothetical protein [Gossypium raimondii]